MGPNSNEPSGAELRRFLALAWKRKWILLPIIVLIPLATYVVSKGLAKTYRSTTTIQVRDTGDVSSLFGGGVSFGSGTAAEAARLIPTTAVGRRAAQVLHEPPNADLGASITAGVVDTDAGFVDITAEGGDPKRVAAVANAYATAIGASRSANAIAQIDKTIDTLRSQSGQGDSGTQTELASQLQQLRALKAATSDATVVIQPAIPPDSPVSPKPRRNATIGFVLALLLAAGLLPLLESLDRRMRTPDDLEEIAPVLAAIPDEAFPDGRDGPAVREAFQTLRAGLTYFNLDRELSTVMITSPNRGEGKTTTATGLAIALAQEGRRVILIDADLRRPRIAARLEISDRVHFGIEEVISGRKNAAEALIGVAVEGGRLVVLPCASPPPNPSVIMGSGRMRKLIAELAEKADMVIIDTPPLLPVSDAMPLLKQVSGTLLVGRIDETSRDGMRRANRIVGSTGGNLLGTVATGVSLSGLYGYGYGYGEDAEVASNGAGEGRRLFGLRKARAGSSD